MMDKGSPFSKSIGTPGLFYNGSSPERIARRRGVKSAECRGYVGPYAGRTRFANGGKNRGMHAGPHIEGRTRVPARPRCHSASMT